MSQYKTSVYAVTMTSGQTLSSALYLSKPYKNIALYVPTMASGSLYIKASFDNSTYVRVTKGQPNESTDFVVNSAATQRIVPLPPLPFSYLKIENTSGATDVVTTFRVICSD